MLFFSFLHGVRQMDKACKLTGMAVPLFHFQFPEVRGLNVSEL